MAEHVYYLAYGSNLHPQRLRERIVSAQLVGTVSLPNYRLAFHKRGGDHSGKCNLLPGQLSDTVHAAVYTMAEADIAVLDRFEGEGYERRGMRVRCDDSQYDCFYYAALASYVDEDLLPHHWYKQLVLIGAEYHGFPTAYRNMINEVGSRDDPHPQRLQQHLELIQRLKCNLK
jgi:gamma-glutamylcyclotransferase (GGCT)/AIG2-like uncharacterized protein YtfP